MKRKPRIHKKHRPRANTVDYDELIRRDIRRRAGENVDENLQAKRNMIQDGRRHKLPKDSADSSPETIDKGNRDGWIISAKTDRRYNRAPKRHGSYKRHAKDDDLNIYLGKAESSAHHNTGKYPRTAFIDDHEKPSSRKHSKEKVQRSFSTVHVDELLVDDQGRLYFVDDLPQKRSKYLSDHPHASKKEVSRKRDNEFLKNRHYSSRRNKSNVNFLALAKYDEDGNKLQVSSPIIISPQSMKRDYILDNTENQEYACSDNERARGVSGNEKGRKRAHRRKKGVKQGKGGENSRKAENIHRIRSGVFKERHKKKFARKKVNPHFSKECYSDDESAKVVIAKKMRRGEAIKRKKRRIKKDNRRLKVSRGKDKRRTRSAEREKVRSSKSGSHEVDKQAVIRKKSPPTVVNRHRGLSNESSDCPMNPNRQMFVELDMGLTHRPVQTHSLNILPEARVNRDVPFTISMEDTTQEVDGASRKFSSTSKVLMSMQDRNGRKLKRSEEGKLKQPTSRGTSKERRKVSPMRFKKKRKKSKKRENKNTKWKKANRTPTEKHSHTYKKAKALGHRSETKLYRSVSPRQRAENSSIQTSCLDKMPSNHRHSFEATAPHRNFRRSRFKTDKEEEKELVGNFEEEKTSSVHELALRTNQWTLMLPSNGSFENRGRKSASSIDKESESDSETVSPLSQNVVFQYPAPAQHSISLNKTIEYDSEDDAKEEQKETRDDFNRESSQQRNSGKDATSLKSFNIKITRVPKSNSQDLADLTPPSHTQEIGDCEIVDNVDSEQLSQHSRRNRTLKQFPKQEVPELSTELLSCYWSEACNRESTSISFSD